MKKNFYLQHPLMAMNDPHMQHLLGMEGLKGVGAYWVIIEKLSLLPEPRADFKYLRPFCKRKISFGYLKKIILEYELFIVEEDGYFSPAELNPVRKKGEEAVKKVAKNTEETAESNAKSAENEQKTAGKQRNSSGFSPENSPEISVKVLLNGDLAKNKCEKKEENIKDNNITTSSSLSERKKRAAATDEFYRSILALIAPRSLSMANGPATVAPCPAMLRHAPAAIACGIMPPGSGWGYPGQDVSQTGFRHYPNQAWPSPNQAWTRLKPGLKGTETKLEGS